MDPFVTQRGRVAVLDWSDVNTDLIIPARYLKRIERTGYGPLLFADRRYAPGGAPEVDSPEVHGAPDPAFPLNRPDAEGASVLIVGKNFGCGSSREHAVWAVQQAGFRAVVGPGKGEGFADIFEGNAYNNGLLPIELAESDWKAVIALCQSTPGVEGIVDLVNQKLTIHPPKGQELCVGFEVPEAQRERLLKGLDAIAETLQNDPAIRAYEDRLPAWTRPHTQPV
jgi:3-isopropylmalate/(R)-2-methylmalate dehydratase small subunit